MEQLEKFKRLIPTSRVCARYGRVSRTIDRWVEDGELPKPVYIRGLRYWKEEELDQWDEARREGGFELLHKAASRATKHIFQNRADRVDAPLPQAAVGQPGITTTQDD